jgi:hypothetical protein
MADDLTNPGISDRPSLARIQAVPWMIVIGLIALSAWLGWKAFFDRPAADPVASAMLAFEKQNALTVFSSRFEIVAESTNTTSLGPIDVAQSRQAAIIPATVEYRLDLAQMDRDRFVWDETSQTMEIVLPALKISRPNLDEAQRRVFTEGAWVTRKAAENLSRENSRQAEAKAAAFAQNPEVLALARQAGKQAVAQNLAIPMAAAGFADVTIAVRYDGEKTLAR